jgi:hypothetical protein
MKLSSKSKSRIELLDFITEGVSTQEVFKTINYKTQSEDKIKHFIYPHLLDALTEWVMQKKDFSRALAKEKAKAMLKWEGNVNTTINHMQFMGTANRPDMIVETQDLRIAIEFKKGERGSDLRSGFGQCMIYSTSYDFVLYMFIDTTQDSKIAKSVHGIAEQQFLEGLWENFNIKFVIV